MRENIAIFGRRAIWILAAGVIAATLAPAWSQGGATYGIVAFSGQGAPGGGNFYAFDAPRIGQNGAVAFASLLASEGDGHRVFAGLPGALQLIAALNQPAPGLEATFTTFSGVTINSLGGAAFDAVALGGDTTISGIWAGKLALGIHAGGGLNGVPGYLVTDVGPPSFNSLNQLAAKVGLTASFETLTDINSALAVGLPGVLHSALAVGDAAPGFPFGTKVVDLFDDRDPANDRVDQNDAGTLVFRAGVSAQPGPTPAQTGVLYVGAPGQFQPVAVENAPAPGIAHGLFSGLHADPSISSDGKVAFVADLSADSEDSIDVPNQAIFEGTPGTLHPIVRSGDSVPGAPGVVFSNLFRAGVNATGDVVFLANITYPNHATRRSLWVQRASGPPVLLAASGVSLDTPSGSKEALGVDFAGPGAFNDLNQAVFEASFANGRGIYLADTRPGPPVVTVTTPGQPKKFVTMSRKILVAGIAEDPTGVARVEYSVKSEKQPAGKSRSIPVRLAKGSTNWSFKVPLTLGRNRISITATDRLGNRSDPVQLIVLRYVCGNHAAAPQK
ncbi:MAG: hypothetical protein PHC88_15405 [Terrimicrobiaceae bacterium]|nr:hypothetical protein [Terrimicrobiaceae bacterium]